MTLGHRYKTSIYQVTDLTFGDLDLKFSGKLWNSCANSYAKNGAAAAIVKKLNSWTSPPPPSRAWINMVVAPKGVASPKSLGSEKTKTVQTYYQYP